MKNLLKMTNEQKECRKLDKKMIKWENFCLEYKNWFEQENPDYFIAIEVMYDSIYIHKSKKNQFKSEEEIIFVQYKFDSVKDDTEMVFNITNTVYHINECLNN